MSYARALIILAILSSACAKEQPDDQARQPSSEAGTPTPTPEPTPQPVIDEAGRVSVSAAAAKAAGLAPLSFHLDVGSSGMQGSTFAHGAYLTLSGPPGGPLMLRISPATVGVAFADVVGGEQLLDATLVEQEVELLGATRRAVAWITGSSLARTSWCGILVAPEGAVEGEPALLVELGVGYGGDQTTCATAREHQLLESVVDSLHLD